MLNLTSQYNQNANHNANPLVIMCPPNHIALKPADKAANAKEIQYSADFWRDPKAFQDKALQQWQNAASISKTLGGNVLEMPPAYGYGDHPYTADPVFSLFNAEGTEITVIKSLFTNSSRQREVDYFVKFLETQTLAGKPLEGIKLNIHTMTVPFEGKGDNQYDPFRDVIFSGYVKNPNPADPASGRSSLAAHDELAKITNTPVFSIELKPPCFHVDTCLAPLSGGHMLIYKEGMTDDSYNRLIKEQFIDRGLDPAKYVYHVSENDALNNYATNLKCYGKNVAICEFGEDVPPLEPALLTWLKVSGYHVEVGTYGQMIKGGGGYNCTKHDIRQRVPGGYISRTAMPSTQTLEF